MTGKKAMPRSLPLILTLDQHGVPHRWVTWQQAVWYYAKQRVAWEMGREEFTFWGGRCHRTGERSSTGMATWSISRATLPAPMRARAATPKTRR